MEIELVTKADVGRIMEIYRYYVEQTDITFEYVMPSEEEFTGRIRDILKKFPYLVAKEDGKIWGYAYAAPFKGRAAYDWSVETTIYVDQEAPGRGIGTQLYRELEKRLAAQNIQNLNACITYPNDRSISFHTKRGYKTVAHFTKCGYKFDRWLDMIWMEKFLGTHPEVPQPVRWANLALE